MYRPGYGHVISDMDETIQALRRKGVHLWMENGTLRYRARKGLMTADDLVSLRGVDGALLSLLLEQESASGFEPRLLSRARPARAPLAFSQLAHWNLRAQAGYRPIRQVASATCLRGRLDVGALQEALSVVVNRHEALRTHIVRDWDLVQQIDVSGCRLEVRNLEAIPACDRAVEIQKQIASAIVELTDYVRDPLFQPVLLRLGDNEHILILALDHMVSDGASLSILLDELLTAHAQLVEDHAVSLPAVQMQLADYAYWQRAALTGWLKRQASEWRSRRRTRFPEDPFAGQRRGWEIIRFVIDPRTKSALQEQARRRGTSLVMMVLAAYVALILRWCEVSETVVQVMSDGRTSRLIENTIGYLAFPLYLSVHFEGRGRFTDLLEVITAEYCKACERPDFYFSYAQSHCPQFVRNTCFNWLPRREGWVGAEPGGTASPTCSRVAFEHPLLETLDWDAEPSIVLQDTLDEIIVEVGFPRQRLSRATMERFAASFRAFVDALIATPAVRVRDAPMT